MIERERQKLLKWLTPYITKLIDSKLGSLVSRNSQIISDLSEYLRRDGSVVLTGNLSVVDGKTIDGVDVSALGSSYSTHLAGDGHSRYAEAAGYTNRPAAVATTLTRSVTPSAPLTGGGTLTSDIALGINVGSGLQVDSGALRMNPNVAGDGLSHAAGVLSINAGNGLSLSGGSLNLNLGAGLSLSGDDAILAPSVAGNGLVYSAGSLNIELADGLEFDGDSIAHGETYQHYHPIYPRTAENETILGQWDFDETVGLGGGAITDNNLVPFAAHSHSVGSAIKPFNSIHAAELHVGHIVAQDTIATIGGSILVTPSTHLSVDLTDVSTQITVDHNILESGDTVIIKDGGMFEAIKVTSGVSYNLDGTYSYIVERNQDGSGANNWVAGTAVASLGGIHDGWIDIFSTTPATGSGHGPTVVFYHREGTTWNDFVEHTVLGTLHGFYDYDSHVHGFAAGDPDDVWVAVDDTNGFRIMNGLTQKAVWMPDGTILIGSTAPGQANIIANANSMKFRQGTVDKIALKSDGSIEIADGDSSVVIEDDGIKVKGAAGLLVGEIPSHSEAPGFATVSRQDIKLWHNDGYLGNEPSVFSMTDGDGSGSPIERFRLELSGYFASPSLSLTTNIATFPISNTGGSITLSATGGIKINSGLTNHLTIGNEGGDSYKLNFTNMNGTDSIRLRQYGGNRGWVFTAGGTDKYLFNQDGLAQIPKLLVVENAEVLGAFKASVYQINRGATGDSARIQFQSLGTTEWFVGIPGGSPANFQIQTPAVTALLAAKSGIGVSIGHATFPESRLDVGDGHIRLVESGTASAPSTNSAVIGLRDNGLGKSELYVRFATGAVQVIKTEP